ncbi:SDR family oxidoreductase [Ferrovibrio terrae]|uniref:SDR family oxidoreductase n=1 Tax=Ferrovibrio terrae TaxID=2594003 RepID=UPI003137FEDC
MSGRIIVLTGASGLVGRRLVGHFLTAGDRLVALTSRPESAQSLQAEFDSKDLVCLGADLTQPGGVTAVCHELRQRGLLPHALINNARQRSNLAVGSSGPDAAQWQAEFMLGVIASERLTSALAQQAGSCLRAVVNISSMYGAVAVNPGLYADPTAAAPIHYGVVKAALNHLTRELAVRLAGRGIRVNAVGFGGIEGRVDATFKENYARLCPAGRMVSPEEIAGPVDFLLSDAAGAVTGVTLPADGGWTLW